MLHSIRLRSFVCGVLLAASPVLVTSASATIVNDPVADFLPTYTGPANGDMDIRSFGVTLTGTTFNITTVLGSPFGTTAGAVYVYGVNRGAGTAAFGASLGLNNVLFDTTVRVNADGTVTGTLVPAGTPNIVVSGNSFTFSVSSTLMTSTGFALGDYGWNVWPRALGPAGTAAISDFAPNNATISSAPEPGTWATMMIGFGLLGMALRRTSAKLAKAFA